VVESLVRENSWEIAVPGAAVVDGGSATDSRNPPGDERGMKTVPETSVDFAVVCADLVLIQ